MLVVVSCFTIDAKVKRNYNKSQSSINVAPKDYVSNVDAGMVKELLTSYVENKLANRDASQALLRLNTIYAKQVTEVTKNHFRDAIYQSIIDYQKADRNLETLAAIDVFQLFAEPYDKRMPTMHFVKGDISAHVLNDTLALKDCIAELLVVNKTDNVKEYIKTLRSYLQEIRDYVPVFDRIGSGIWVSVNLHNNDNGYPYYMLIKGDDGSLALHCGEAELNQLNLQKKTLGEAMLATLETVNKSDLNQLSLQKRTELGNNSAYFVWSSEHLDMPSDMDIAIKNSVTANVGNAAGSLFSNAIGSSFLGSIFGDMAGSLIGGLFKKDPKKIINICEAVIYMVNDFEIEANIKPQQIVVTPNKEQKHEREDKVLFMKLTPDIMNRLVLYDLQGLIKELSNECGKKEISVWKKRLSSKDAIKQWNCYQLAQLYNRNEKTMIDNQIKCSQSFHNKNDVNSLGLYLQDIEGNPKLQKKHPDAKGVLVSGFHAGGTGAIYGIKKGDIIQSIDGCVVNTVDDINNYVRSLERFSPVKVKVIRGWEEVEIDVEHIGLNIDIMGNN